jgi:membrane protease YdiL (CAAX protease family)
MSDEGHGGSGKETAWLAVFYALAVGLSWLVWAPLVAGRLGYGPEAPVWLHLAGSLGPAVAALLLAALPGSPLPLRDLLAQFTLSQRATSVGLGIGLPVAIGLAGLVIQQALSGESIAWSAMLGSKEYAGLSGLPLIAAWVVFYGFGEEIGWRGFALPIFLRRHGPLAASLIMTVPWAIWHLPLLLSSDTYRSLGMAGLAGWLFSLATGSILMTYVFLRTRRSLPAVAVFHALIDLFMVSPATDAVGLNVLGALVTVAGLVAAWRLWFDGGSFRGLRR